MSFKNLVKQPRKSVRGNGGGSKPKWTRTWTWMDIVDEDELGWMDVGLESWPGPNEKVPYHIRPPSRILWRGGGRWRERVIIRQTSNTADPETDLQNFKISDHDAKSLFTTMPFEAHKIGQEQNKYRYLALMTVLQMSGTDISLAAKTRALAAAWSRHDMKLSEEFLKDRKSFGVVEVLEAVTLLDSGRKAREHEKRIASLRQCTRTAGKKGKGRLGRQIHKLKKAVNNCEALKPSSGTLNSALVRHIKRWTRTISAEELEFNALHLPEKWKQLAAICHLHPEKDFPTLPWFLRSCYDASAAPEDSLCFKCAGMNEKTVNEILWKGVQVPYTHLKQFNASLNQKSKTLIAKYTTDLDTILWHYEDLECSETDEVIERRLDNNEEVKLSYGELMERLLLMKNRRYYYPEKVCFYPKLILHTKRMLLDIKVPLESPIVVIGDVSESMKAVIETSTIVASLLRALTNAQLVFFSNDIIEPPFIPTTVAEVLQLATIVKTVTYTACHASALWPFYKKKQVVKTFILTTDEEENTDYRGDDVDYNFRSLFEKYHDEVYPSRLVFISFLFSQYSEGRMVSVLKEDGYDVLQFKFDRYRPDLTKLNNLVRQLVIGTKDFDTKVNELEAKLRNEGLQKAFENFTSKIQS